jgi:hypothetical protein
VERRGSQIADNSRIAMTTETRFSTLDADKIAATIERLSRRISERFPDSSLSAVCGQLHAISQKTKARSAWIGTPIIGLRIATSVLIALIVAGLAAMFFYLRKPDTDLTIAEFIQLFESGINDVILIGLAILFLATMETRIKRGRALKALHELRAIAHIIDMHQLTKDPDSILSRNAEGASLTPSSPQRTLTAFELSRYLDYCSELLSLTGKIAALYVQQFDDGVVLASVNEIETLTTGLSNKIWQKLVILHSLEGP